MRTSNPALNDRVFEPQAYGATDAAVMTLNGTVVKTAILIGILLTTAAYSWSQTWAGIGATAVSSTWVYYVLFGSLAGFVVALVTIFAPKVSPVTAPVYAALEGLVLGAISAVFEGTYRGIVIQAVGLTVSVLVILLVAYASRLIQASENFKLGIVSATGAICLVYLTTMVLSWFGVRVPYIHESGWIGIGFSLFVVVIAALNLVLDFDFIEQGTERGAPKYMEWYGGFGLLVTLIWLYLEVLRLLAKLRDR